MLTSAFGLVGLLLAPLLSATLQNIFKYLLPPPLALDPPAQAAGQPLDAAATLRARLETMKEGISDQDPAPSLNIMSLAERLDHLIAEAELYLDGSSPDVRIAANPHSRLIAKQ
jgi:hypothetical protein